MVGIAQLKALVGIDTSAYKAGANDVRRQNENLRRSFQQVGQALGLAFGVGAIIAMGRRVMRWAGDLSIAARNAGMLTHEMMGLDVAAVQAGVSIGEMQKLVQRMQQSVTDAIRKGGEYAEVFKRMGLNVDDLARMLPAQMFEAVTKAAFSSGHALENVEKIFGRLGRNAMVALRDIAENGMPKVSEAAGIAADKVEAAMSRMNKKMRDVGAVLLELAIGFDDLIEKAAKVVSGDLAGAGPVGAYLAKRQLDTTNLVPGMPGLIPGMDGGKGSGDPAAIRLHEMMRQAAELARAAMAERDKNLDEIRSKERKISQDKIDQIKKEIEAEEKKAQILKEQVATRFKALGVDRSATERVGAVFGGPSSAGMQTVDKQLSVARHQVEIQQRTNERIQELKDAVDNIRREIANNA